MCVTRRTEPYPPNPTTPFTSYTCSSVRRGFILRHGRVRFTGSEDVTINTPVCATDMTKQSFLIVKSNTLVPTDGDEHSAIVAGVGRRRPQLQ